MYTNRLDLHVVCLDNYGARVAARSADCEPLFSDRWSQHGSWLSANTSDERFGGV